MTLFENNDVNPYRPHTCEATLEYMIRQKGELTVQTENQILGLFPQTTWEALFNEFALDMDQFVLNGIYDNYILDDGDYPLTVFVGRKQND